MLKLMISIMISLLVLSLNSYCGENENNFILNVKCYDPIFLPVSQTVCPKPDVEANGDWVDFTSDNVSEFEFEGNGQLTYKVTVTEWDKKITIDGADYELDVSFWVNDDNFTTNHNPGISNQGDYFIIDPLGVACNAVTKIKIIANKAKASVNAKAIPVTFKFKMSAEAN